MMDDAVYLHNTTPCRYNLHGLIKTYGSFRKPITLSFVLFCLFCIKRIELEPGMMSSAYHNRLEAATSRSKVFLTNTSHPVCWTQKHNREFKRWFYGRVARLPQTSDAFIFVWSSPNTILPSLVSVHSGEGAAKPLTAVQDCILTFVSVTSLDII